MSRQPAFGTRIYDCSLIIIWTIHDSRSSWFQVDHTLNLSLWFQIDHSKFIESSLFDLYSTIYDQNMINWVGKPEGKYSWEKTWSRIKLREDKPWLTTLVSFVLFVRFWADFWMCKICFEKEMKSQFENTFILSFFSKFKDQFYYIYLY